ncbi:7-cyano-7-deazaguanine synthase [bacterium]|nr:7-cyano-7-deazaguanine synthase [bacterium]
MTQLKLPFSKQAVLSLSGGMDSSTLLLRLLKEGYDVTAISFDYGQKHRVELERAQQLVDYLNSNFSEKNHRGDDWGKYYPITYQVIKLDGLTPLLNSALVDGGDDVPEGHYENENMKDTVVPNRNKIFSSIVQAVALSKATQNGSPCDIALGIHAGDHAIYPDCRQEFRDADMVAFREGNWDNEYVDFYTPYLDTDKLGILKDGAVCCKSLGLDFDEVYVRTNTSYKPYPSGNSDYKSASSVERIEAFIDLGRKDPVQYEDETGEVTWEVAKAHVESVLANN